ncbi:hypothetical protein [Pedobacter glucosidilyticus]|uniref:hypothetical protein n=1 Tax=Pedobacter glucosidilyticus TaxID=1122941 RepID=UPI0012DD204C|nr:hypothetical protein [Pedobacter glucosidilyticus]
MKKNLYLFLIFMLLSVITGYAQSFKDLKNKKNKNPFTEGNIKLFVRYTHLKGKFTEPLSGPTVNVATKRDRFQANQFRYRFENPTLGDGIFTIVRGFKRLSNDESRVTTNRSELTLASGFVGWHQASYNVLAKDRLIVSPGVSFGDVLLGTKRRTNTQSGSLVTDPAGYYFYAGPHVLVSYLVNKSIWIDTYLNYDITFVKVANPKNDYVENPDYALPTLFTIGGDVFTSKSKLYGGARLVKMMDTGENKDSGTRFDLSLGFVF